MWLFVLCGYYCSRFLHYTSENYSAESTKKGTVIVQSNREWWICDNFEDTREITKPGYWCSNFYWEFYTRGIRTEDNYLYIGLITNSGKYLYCVDYITISSSTSTSTPKITQEPCQRLRIRVVYALIHTLIE